MLKAAQIMTKQFLTISPEMSVEELARLLVRKDGSLFDSAIYLETSEHFKGELHKMVATKVEDIYTKDPVTIDLTSTLADIATLMSEKRIHFLPVMHEKRVDGVVGRREILRALADGS
jgi:CBS domain-containing protein